MRIARDSRAFAAGVALFAFSGSGVAQVAETKGGYAASLKQAFSEDVTREVVWGHFDQGTSADTHRYYCLIDPKTGKTEPNGVAGQLVKRRDGMTGLKDPAVSPLSCVDAQQKGLLETRDYVVKGPGIPAGGLASAAPPAAAAAGAAAAGSASSAPAAGSAALAAGAAGVAATSGSGHGSAPAPAPVAAAVGHAPDPGPAASSLASEIMAVYARFIFAQNAHDRTAVGEVLLESNDFVWVGSGGEAVYGYQQALDAFEQEWRGSWRLDPQPKEMRVVSPAPGIAVLTTPLLSTSGAVGRAATTAPMRCSGVFVRSDSGWRIASIFMTPLAPRASR
jgi:SnoaL-like protein